MSQCARWPSTTINGELVVLLWTPREAAGCIFVYKYKNISTCSIQNYSQGLMSAVGQLFDADCDKLTKQNSSDL